MYPYPYLSLCIPVYPSVSTRPRLSAIETPRIVKNIGYVDMGLSMGAVTGAISAFMTSASSRTTH